jgi:hypothetical protein
MTSSHATTSIYIAARIRVKIVAKCSKLISEVLWCCIETTLTGESRFHMSTPLGIEPGSLVTGSEQVVHWTSET